MKPLAITILFFAFSISHQLAAQSEVEPPVSKACESAERRAFDFWVGDWVVHRPDGQLAGHNRITRIEGGCALREEWRSANGSYTGSSYNAFNPATDKWHQTWVDNQGGVLQLSGGLDGEDMVLTSAGQDNPDQDAKLDRIRWTPLPDGRVRQLWEKSDNGGADWRTVFDGYYSRR
jgi:hypothetical protein